MHSDTRRWYFDGYRCLQLAPSRASAPRPTVDIEGSALYPSALPGLFCLFIQPASISLPTSTKPQKKPATDTASVVDIARAVKPVAKGAQSRKTAGPKVDRRKAPLTKEKILDAAESLFVQRGYYGTSLRDISKVADIQLALTHYHFGSKEDLFRAVIDRRADANVGAMRRALDDVLAEAGESSPDPEQLLRAFIGPVVNHALRGGEGWRDYIRLLAQVANLPQEESFIVPVNTHYDSVVKDFIAALCRIYPAMATTDVHWYFHFFQATISHVLVESGMVDRQSHGRCQSADLDTIVDKMVRFFAAGFSGALDKKGS